MITTKELMKNFGIAITGNIATGKSHICKILENMNYPVIDADKLARKVSEKGAESYKKIVSFFGTKILKEDKTLDRKKLSYEIFQDKEKRLFLESVIHPAIQIALKKQLESLNLYKNPKLWFYEAALIIEKNKFQLFKEVWITHCNMTTQINRLKSRSNNYSDTNIKNIIASQKIFAEKRKFCNFEINTDLSEDLIKEKIKEKFKLI